MFHSGDFFFFITISCLVSLFLWIFLSVFVYQQVLLLTKYIQTSVLTLSYQVILNKCRAAQLKFHTTS